MVQLRGADALTGGRQVVMRSHVSEPGLADPGDGLGADRNSPIAARPLYALLDDAAARFAAAPCLDFLGLRYRYRDVARLVARAARGLQAIGVFPGTRVGLMLPNTPYFVVLYFAVLKAGGVVVCFNPLLAEREIEQQIADSGVEIMATLDLGALVRQARQGAASAARSAIWSSAG